MGVKNPSVILSSTFFIISLISFVSFEEHSFLHILPWGHQNLVSCRFSSSSRLRWLPSHRQAGYSWLGIQLRCYPLRSSNAFQKVSSVLRWLFFGPSDWTHDNTLKNFRRLGVILRLHYCLCLFLHIFCYHKGFALPNSDLRPVSLLFYFNYLFWGFHFLSDGCFLLNQQQKFWIRWLFFL